VLWYTFLSVELTNRLPSRCVNDDIGSAHLSRRCRELLAPALPILCTGTISICPPAVERAQSSPGDVHGRCCGCRRRRPHPWCLVSATRALSPSPSRPAATPERSVNLAPARNLVAETVVIWGGFGGIPQCQRSFAACFSGSVCSTPGASLAFITKPGFAYADVCLARRNRNRIEAA
jgi:hypothetical protein